MNKQKIIILVLTIAALAVVQSAWAVVSNPVRFRGFHKTINNTSQYAWGIDGLLGENSFPPQDGTSQAFSGQTINLANGNSVTITGTFNFAESATFTDITTGSQVTLVFNSSYYWFYGASVKKLDNVSVSGCSSTISSDKHTITVTIPSGRTFGQVYFDFVANQPMTNSNTTVTVPTGDYWVSDASHKPTPVPTVTYFGNSLTQGTDYTLSWSNNSSVGTGTVTVTGTGEYAGTATGTFSIRWATYTVRFNKNAPDATGEMSDMNFTYATAQNLTANAFTRTGYVFAGWTTNADGTGNSYTDGQEVINLTATNGAVIDLYAQWIPQNVTYIDADGTEKSIAYTNFTILSDNTITIRNDLGNIGNYDQDTWYVAIGNYTFNHNYLNALGHVHLILCDGATFTVSGNFYGISASSLTVYGQSGGTGRLVASNTATSGAQGAICVSSALTINGGNVNATGDNYGIIAMGSNSSNSTLTINGGNVNATGGQNAGIICDGNITINGGTVEATGGENSAGISGRNITLGWTSTTDRITASSYKCSTNGTISVKEGQALSDGINSYTGTLTTEQISAIAGKTLQPAITYIDENGNEQSIAYPNFTLLSDNTITISNDLGNIGKDDQDTWYVAIGNYTFNHNYLNALGHVHLILCDGATFTVSGNFYGISASSLTVYGQSGGTGRLVASTTAMSGAQGAIRVSRALTINGGNVSTSAVSGDGISCTFYSNLTINGGTVNATGGQDGHGIDGRNIFINGGTVNATGGQNGHGISGNNIFIYGGNVNATGGQDGHGISSGNITLGWTNANDRITASSYYSEGTISVKDGQAFSDGTNIYSSNASIADINGKTLRPCLLLADGADNTAAINNFNGQHFDAVMLQGRTLWKDGNWNTLCLPFGLSSFSDTPLEGATVMELGNSEGCNTGFDANTGTLTLDFVPAYAIEAGHAYIVKWENASGTIENPTFSNVSIENEDPADQSVISGDGCVRFRGTYTSTTFTEEDKSILFLGAQNKLFYPLSGARIGAFRAYFQFGNTAGVRKLKLNFGEEDSETSLSEELRVKSEELNDAWYDLSGRKVNSQSSILNSQLPKGIYINNGKKIVK